MNLLSEFATIEISITWWSILPSGGMLMNKKGMRWVSLILSVAVMIGSLTYIAADFNAETSGQENFISSTSSSAAAGVLLEADGIIPTDADRVQESTQDKWVYKSVLRDDAFLVGSKSADIYFDLVATGATGAAVGDKISMLVTMENTTANDTKLDSETNKTVSAAACVNSLSFGVSYDADILTFTSGKSNIEGVKFTQTGKGNGASVQISYTSGDDLPVVAAHEMLCFELCFEAISETASANDTTSVSIESSNVLAATTLTSAAGQPLEYKIYRKNGNSALDSLTLSLKDGTSVILNPDFDPNVNDYFVTVPYDTKKADIIIATETADANATAAKVWSNGDAELPTGISTCTVTVKAADGTTQDYRIVVKKLSLDTLADPQKTLTKTIEVAEKGSATVKDAYNVTYAIDGVNDILAGGNDYVIYISAGQTNTIDPETIRANTANLLESTLTVIDASGSAATITTYDLSDPALSSTSKTADSTIDPVKFITSDELTNNTRYLITVSGDNDVTIEDKEGYTQISLPDDNNMSANLAAAGFDNTAAEFVFIVDFSSVTTNGAADQNVNNALIKALFGYDDGNSATNDIPGYVQQVKNMLSNDSTAKITIIAVGADIGAGLDEDEWASYGIQFVNTTGTGTLTDAYSYDLTNSVYCGQTYVLPQANSEFWGDTASNSEQHNLWEYVESYNTRQIGTSSEKYTSAVPADSELVAQQLAAAMTKAGKLLENANNAQLVVLTPNQTAASKAYTDSLGTASDIDLTIVPVNGYASLAAENRIATEVYEDLVVESKSGFNCDPGENERTITLVDEINRLVYYLTDMNASMSVVNASALAIDNVEDQYKIDLTYYLPSIGDYELCAEYVATRWSNANVNTSDTHYYPISNTVLTETGTDGSVTEDDIPTIAPSYDNEYELTITKGITKFDDSNAVKPTDSTVTYVLLYTNTGTKNLTSVGITDSQIMTADEYEVYLLAKGIYAPEKDDKPLNVKFTASSSGSSKGELTVDTLEPGQTIYVKYTITVPESTSVTTGTTKAASADNGNVITSYIIENIATGAAKEVDMTQVKLDVEFEYDKASNGTVTSSTTSSTTFSNTTSSSTTLPTITTYSSTTKTTLVYKDDVQTGESSIGYIMAMSLLFGALGVFGVTIYGIVLDKRIERMAANAKVRR